MWTEVRLPSCPRRRAVGACDEPTYRRVVRPPNGSSKFTRLTAKQSSFRLPVHVAATLSALCELYPNKTRTQNVGDLLATAIDASVGGLQSI